MQIWSPPGADTKACLVGFAGLRSLLSFLLQLAVARCDRATARSGGFAFDRIREASRWIEFHPHISAEILIVNFAVFRSNLAGARLDAVE